MLEIEGLSARAGRFLLRDINLVVGEGECHVVLGPSGSGKSTLLNGILGTLPVLAGRLRLAGRDITNIPVERRQLGYVPQQLGLFPHLSVADNLSFSARARRIPDAEFQPLLKKLVEITGIGHLLERRPHRLSGGERQRVALVRALVANPSLVLLDEPFTALDESLRRELWWLVKDLQRERGLTVLLVTHNLSEAHFFADSVTVLIDGRQEQSGRKETLYRRPASLAVAQFLGLKNLFPARVRETDRIDCKSLGGMLTVQTDAQPMDTPVWLGIRPEHVALRQPSDPPRLNEARVSGYYSAVIDMGETTLLQFRTDAGAVLEIRCGSRLLRRYPVKPGEPGQVGLPAGDLFILPGCGQGLS